MDNATLISPDNCCFQIIPGDLRPLCQRLGLDLSPLSPLAGMAAERAPGSDAAVLADLAGQSALARAMSILARPDLKMECVIGGGASALGHVAVCRKNGIPGVVAVLPVTGNAALIQGFPDAAFAGRWLTKVLNTLPEFLAWDAPTLRSVASRPEITRALPAKMPLETLFYLFHAIDMYRAAVYQGLLQHKPIDFDIRVGVADFNSGLAKSMVSGDIRWLLPAFLRLVPGLRDFELDPQPSHLDSLVACGVVSAVAALAGEPACYVFGEAGSQLGLEFYRTWHGAVGLTLETAAGPASRSHFLAPTAFANHLFSMEADAQSRGQVHYDALTGDALELFLQRLLDTQVVRAAGPEPSVVVKEAAAPPVCWHFALSGVVQEPVDESVLRARLARGELPGDTLVWNPALSGWISADAAGLLTPPAVSPPSVPPPASRVCPRCAAPLEPGMRFCTGCGAPLA